MAKTLRSVPELQAAGLVSAAETVAVQAVAARYAVAITPAMTALIDRADPDDPIARQFVPDARELQHHPQRAGRPDRRRAIRPRAGHRAPLPGPRAASSSPTSARCTAASASAARTVGPGGPQALGNGDPRRALAYIAGDQRIWEVILTGGDPFMLSARRIAT
jgi:lysine 2,3-aminomutase